MPKRLSVMMSFVFVFFAAGAFACGDCHLVVWQPGVLVSYDCGEPGYAERCATSSSRPNECWGEGFCNTCFDYSQEIADCGPDVRDGALRNKARHYEIAAVTVRTPRSLPLLVAVK
jgi:hypothetical protein